MSNLFARPIIFPLIDSTNQYLADQARLGAPEGMVAIADQQSAGRGRQGRTWVAGPGTSLLMSMLFRPALDLAEANLVPTIVGLATHQVVGELTGAECELKWPNDLLIGGKKVSGLLGEIVPLPPGYAMVVGIGLNLYWPEGPPQTEGDQNLEGLGDRATTLFDVAGERFDRDHVAAQILQNIADDYSRLGEPGIAAKIMDRYRRACGTIGRDVEVQMAAERYRAHAVGVSDQGRLIIEVQGELKELDAADVVHLRTP